MKIFINNINFDHYEKDYICSYRPCGVWLGS